MLIDAWVAETAGAPLVPRRLELDELRAGEVLVRIGAAGVCHTDISYTDGSRPAPFPLIAGHEGAGVVSAVGAGVTEFAVGDRVVLSFSSCGNCRSCRLGRPSYCDSFRRLNTGFGGADEAPRFRTVSGSPVTGGFFGQSCFAGHALTRPRNLVRLPESVPFAVAAPFGCGVQTGAGAVLNTLKAGTGASIAVFGAGAVGLSAVMAAAAAGAATIAAVDPIEQRRALAKTLGARQALDPAEAGTLAGFDYAIDTTGRPDVIRTAVAATHNTGTTCLIGSGPAGTEVSLPLRDLVVGRRVRGLVEGDSVPQVFLPLLLGLWESGRFPVEALITTFPSTELNAAMHAMHTGHAVKPVVVFPDSPGVTAGT
ncbi:MAG TPA: NAD(P)-dependent alcohol dehydrogenase [Amycolatopsis sp.]|nr:NAD(P)-dependent alcohol dehydrogenase [Amycolatopsis sp.]